MKAYLKLRSRFLVVSAVEEPSLTMMDDALQAVDDGTNHRIVLLSDLRETKTEKNKPLLSYQRSWSMDYDFILPYKSKRPIQGFGFVLLFVHVC